MEVEENGRICDGLVVLLCISRGCQFQATEKNHKIAEHDAKTYGKLSLLIFITLYQHLGSKGAKFFALRSISTDHLNQAKGEAECGRYEIQ